MLKLNYVNVFVCKFHQELINLNINPDAVMTLQDGSCELQFHKIFKFELKDEEGNVTGYEYKEKIEVVIDEGLETERTEGQLIDFDYDALAASIQTIVDCHDNTPFPIQLTTEEKLAQLDEDVQVNFEMNLTAGGFW